MMEHANNRSAHWAVDLSVKAASEPSADAVEMLGITKRFGSTIALDQMSVRIAKGSLHALLGENGAGKSTLVKILNGVYPVGSYEGQVLLDGTPVQFHSPHDALCKGVGYVPQEIALLDDLSVAENIFVGHWTPNGSPVIHWSDLNTRAAAILERVNARLDPCVKVSSLNADSRQLVMIARALSMNPSVLVLDEPTSSLNKAETEALSACLRGLRAQGVTIILITHRLAEVIELADAATVLRDGRQAAHFERAEFDGEKIVTAMVGRRMDSFFPAHESAIREDTPALNVENLCVPHPRVRNRHVVEGVGFSVRRGEILGLYGLLGSGCHEVLCALYGLIPHAGRVWVNGNEVEVSSPRGAKAHGIGLVTDDRKKHGLLFNFGIRENVTLHDLKAVSSGGLLHGNLETRHAMEFKDRLGIRAASVQMPVLNLSGGNQQKVVLAKALFPKPRVLLMDEPTKGVDVGAKREIYSMMTELVREGMALVLVASELPELLALCDRVIVLARGSIADQFSRSEADEQRLMLAATGAKEELKERKDT